MKLPFHQAERGRLARPAAMTAAPRSLRAVRGHFAFMPSLVVALSAVLALVWPSAARAQSFSKEAMLRDMAHEVIVPAYDRFAATSAALADATDKFASAPSIPLLREARSACNETLLAWKAASCLLNGPVADLELTSKFTFWPARAENIEAMIAGTVPLTRETVAEQGVTTSSLHVIEYLLFTQLGRGGTTEREEVLLEQFQGERGARRLQLLTAVARVTADRARLLADAWSPAKGNHGETFARAGQESVGWLANDLVASVEDAVETRLFEVMDFNPASSPQDLNWIQGAPGGISQRSILETLRAARALASRFEPQLRSSGSPVAGRLQTQFEKTIAAVEAIGGPLESALPAKRETVEAAHQEGKKLEILLKTELISALGVTLTFVSGDGD